MAGLGLLLRVRIRAGWNTLRFGRPGHRYLSGALGLGGVALSIFLFLVYRILLLTARSAGEAILDLLIARTLLFLLLFLLAGAVPFVSATLFSPGDLSLLRATPIQPAAVVAARLLDGAVVSSAQI